MNEKLISVMSLIVALVSLYYILCVGIRTNAASMFIAILGVLVTLLVAWNIVQYMFAKDEVRRISKEESDKAAREATVRVRTDLQHIVDALSPLVNARINSVFDISARAIGWYCASLEEYGNIQDSILRQEYVSNLFEEFLRRVEVWKEDNRLYIDKKRLDNYISLLDTFDNQESAKIKEYLLNAREETEEDRGFDHISPL